jgi:serralysin
LATAVNVSATNNADIDGLLAGTKWSGTISYSFPTSSSTYANPYSGVSEPTTSGFATAPTQMQAAINYAIALIKSYTGASITYNGTGSTDIMVAQSPAANPTSYAYYPGNYAAGGDIWFGTQYDYTQAKLGNYYFTTALHELGHALGLKHSQETGGVANVAVPSAHDDSEYTVMSYRSYVGGPLTGYTNEAYGYPQTYMANDILALQTLYGANYNTQSGNTVYTWSPTTGQEFINGVGQPAPGGGVGGSANRIYETVWDGNGVDTYDLSNYTTNLTINLNPGASSVFSTAQLAYLGNGHYASGNVYNAYLYNGDARSYIDNATGGSGNDTIIGNAIANVLKGGAGNDTITGGGGNDTIIGGSGTDALTGGDGADTFLFGLGDSSASSGQHDRITDFTSGVDKINLSGIDAISSTGGYDQFRFIGVSGFSGSAGELNYFNSALGVTTLQGDTNGDRVADFAIDLVGNIAIAATDLIGAVTGPIVTASAALLPHGTTSVAVSSLFTVNNASGPTQSYRFWDGTTDPNSGYFELNGVPVAQSLSSFEISAAQLANLTYIPGSVADELWVRASDGQSFGAWTVFTEAPPVNHAPLVTASTALLHHGTTSVVASSLFSVNDADADPIQSYRFWDGTADPNSGHFELNGVPVAQSLSSFEISAAQLANLTYIPGSVADELWVRASDGQSFGAWTVFTEAPPPVNHVPEVTASTALLPHGTTSVVASSLFSVNDADADPIQSYRFWDGTADPNSGHFELNGVAVTQSLSSFEISAAQLASLTYVPGSVADELWVRASDGQSFGNWTVFTEAPPINHAPVVTASTALLPHGTTSVAASSLFSVNDTDADPIQSYRFWDGTADPNSGHFELNGVAVTQSLSSFEISAAQLANLTYVPGSVADELWVRASDGQSFGNWTVFTEASPINHAPVKTASATPLPDGAGSAAASLFTASNINEKNLGNWAGFVDHLLANQVPEAPTREDLNHLTDTAYQFLIHV